MLELNRIIAKNSGLTRRQCMMLGVMGLAGMMFPLSRSADANIKDDLESLSNLAWMTKRERPLLTFQDFVVDADDEVERHIKHQWRQRKDLLVTLKERLGSDQPIRLSVEETKVRLMFVPQQETGAEAAYQRYCLDVTDFLFDISQRVNILAAIIRPGTAYPLISDDGISAFLVHRLAKAYQSICRFTAKSGNSVKYKVTGAIFSNHLGAVDLTVEMLAQGQFGLSRSPFTIWQSAGGGLSTLMAIPLEECLHYCLGAATDRQIADVMQKDPPESLAAAKWLAEEWMAIEEAAVGGLVEHALARFCDRYNMNPPVSLHEEMRPAIAALAQYRFREKGIRLIRRLGFQEAVNMYLEDPAFFRDQLLRSEAS